MYIDDIYIYILYLYYLCIQYMYIYTGWWFQALWQIWVRQLGWWHSPNHQPDKYLYCSGHVFLLEFVLTQLFTIETLEHGWASMMSVDNISACMYCYYQDIIFLWYWLLNHYYHMWHGQDMIDGLASNPESWNLLLAMNCEMFPIIPSPYY